MIDNLLLKLRARHKVSAEEEAALRGVFTDTTRYPPDRTIIEAGQELNVSTLLLDGLMARYKDLSEGQRQITELHVTGDFADLHSFTLKRLDHNVMTLTPCQVLAAPHENLKALTRDFPHLARLLWFSTNLDAAIQREWTVSLGRRSAIARTAHLFCELRERLGLVALASSDGYALQMTQGELAECLGLTSVHVNRVLKELRERGIAEFRGGRVTILDGAALERIAEFDPAYLYLEADA